MNGSVKCWGRNNAGQLGQGHTNTIGDDEDPATGTTVALGSTAIQLMFQQWEITLALSSPVEE